jgi:hypothetical protein
MDKVGDAGLPMAMNWYKYMDDFRVNHPGGR